MAKTKTAQSNNRKGMSFISHGMRFRDRTIAAILFILAAFLVFVGLTNSPASPVTVLVSSSNDGYWLLSLDGQVQAEEGAPLDQTFPDELPLSDVVAASPRSAGGFWAVSSTGGVYGYGGAEYYGGLDGSFPPAPIVDIVPAQTGGYRLVGADGRVYDFNIEQQRPLATPDPVNQIARDNSRAVSAVGLPDGSGFWIVDNMGVVYAYGDAEHLGDLGRVAGLSSDEQIVDMILVEDKGEFGYALLGKNGEVFAFPSGSSVPCLGRQVKVVTGAPLVAAATLKGGQGCLFLDEKGVVASYGDAPAANQ